jgi:hypothetical protein
MKIASLRLLPWMASMQKMQEQFSAAMTLIFGFCRGSLRDSSRQLRPEFDFKK